MLVELMKAVEHSVEILWADRNHRRESDLRVHRIAPSDPTRQLEHIRSNNAEPSYFCGIGRYRDETLGDCGRVLGVIEVDSDGLGRHALASLGSSAKSLQRDGTFTFI
jgi:hypothetical protein